MSRIFIRTTIMVIFLSIASIVIPFMIGKQWGTEAFGTTAFGVFVIGGQMILMFCVMVSLIFDINILKD